MAKSKNANRSKKNNTPNSKSYEHPVEKWITAILVIVCVVVRLFFYKTLAPIFWVALAFLVVKGILFGFLGRSFTYYFKKFKAWRASRIADEDVDDEEDDTDDADDDDDAVDMAAYGFTRVETVVDGQTVTLDKPDDELLSNAKDNAWTAISKKKPDGAVVYAVVERPKLIPAKLKADEEVGPLNVVKKKKPAAKPVDAADKALAAKLLAKGCAPAELVKKVADAKALVATGLFTEDEAIAHVSK